jgi:hypothetical protein
MAERGAVSEILIRLSGQYLDLFIVSREKTLFNLLYTNLESLCACTVSTGTDLNIQAFLKTTHPMTQSL